MGIDRNFLRQCEKQNLIKPKKAYSEWIIHEEYTPKEYSQEDIETVWNAYLCRKMGLSYNEIRKLSQGEEISIRDSLNDLIQKYESQIEELKALTDFMRYVKCFGCLPSMPNIIMGSKNFKDYLIDYMEYLDKDKQLKKILTIVEYISQVDDVLEIPTEKIKNMEQFINANIPKEISNNYSDRNLAEKHKLKSLRFLCP